MSKLISIQNAPHFKWGNHCDGWWLKQHGAFTVVFETMLPGAAEKKHYHQHTEQFFYCLQGELVIELGNQKHVLNQHVGCTISPGIPHIAQNISTGPVNFLVISSANAQQDRFDIE